jgi:hypothetical protein
LRKAEIEREEEEKEHDGWFNTARPMIVPKMTCKEKRLAREGTSDSEGSDYGDGKDDMMINMVFELPADFCAPEAEIAKLTLGAKPGVGVNIMPLLTFEKMGYHEDDLMKTNTILSALTGETTEAKGVMSAELMMGSKTLATIFFVVNVSRRYI